MEICPLYGMVTAMRYVALSAIRSLHGNQVGAPCGWAATMTPSALMVALVQTKSKAEAGVVEPEVAGDFVTAR